MSLNVFAARRLPLTHGLRKSPLDQFAVLTGALGYVAADRFASDAQREVDDANAGSLSSCSSTCRGWRRGPCSLDDTLKPCTGALEASPVKDGLHTWSAGHAKMPSRGGL